MSVKASLYENKKGFELTGHCPVFLLNQEMETYMKCFTSFVIYDPSL